MKYYILVGEKSGDMHAANLMKSIYEKDTQAEIRFLGGEDMANVGGVQYAHYAEVSYMGFWEVFKNAFKLKRKIRECAQDIIDWKPDIVIFVDFSGFNMRIAPLIHEQGYKLYYYIAPKVWAWNTKRVYKMAKYLDRVYCILPFEEEFFKKYGLDAKYIGNPILDEIDKFTPNENFRIDNGLSDKPILAILPGSRKQEIENILQKSIEIVSSFPDYQCVVAGVDHLPKSLYDVLKQHDNIKIIYNQTYDILNVAESAVVTSGTATLETALFNVPQVVVYKTSAITAAIARVVLKIPYVSLVNLVAQDFVAKELLQGDFTVDNIVSELKAIQKGGEKREKMLNDYATLQSNMGKPGISDHVAGHICS